MSYSSQLTKERILSCAAQEFLDRGFADASLRRIAANAQATTGAIYNHFHNKEGLFSALVEPALADIEAAGEATRESDRAYPVQDMLSQKAISSSLESTMSFVEVMYEHKTAFKLLLCRAEGSPYEKALDAIVDSYAASYREYIDWLIDNGAVKRRPGPMELHMLAQAFVSSICECVRHDLSLEDARAYLKSIVVFSHHGWYGLLNLEEDLPHSPPS